MAITLLGRGQRGVERLHGHGGRTVPGPLVRPASVPRPSSAAERRMLSCDAAEARIPRAAVPPAVRPGGMLRRPPLVRSRASKSPSRLEPGPVSVITPLIALSLCSPGQPAHQHVQNELFFFKKIKPFCMVRRAHGGPSAGAADSTGGGCRWATQNGSPSHTAPASTGATSPARGPSGAPSSGQGSSASAPSRRARTGQRGRARHGVGPTRARRVAQGLAKTPGRR